MPNFKMKKECLQMTSNEKWEKSNSEVETEEKENVNPVLKS